jgi:hypothetical protein
MTLNRNLRWQNLGRSCPAIRRAEIAFDDPLVQLAPRQSPVVQLAFAYCSHVPTGIGWKPRKTGAEAGVGDGNRTHNVRSHSPVLCQLSYSHRT